MRSHWVTALNKWKGEWRNNFILPTESGNIGRTAQIWVVQWSRADCWSRQTTSRNQDVVAHDCTHSLLIFFERNTPDSTYLKRVLTDSLPRTACAQKQLLFRIFFFFKCRIFKKKLGLFYSPGWEGVSWHIHGYRHTHTGQSLPLPFWAALLELGEAQKNKAECSRTLCGTNRTLPVVTAPLVFHRYKQSRGRRQIKSSQQTPWMHSNG